MSFAEDNQKNISTKISTDSKKSLKNTLERPFTCYDNDDKDYDINKILGPSRIPR